MSEPLKIEVSGTPNPNSMKFTLNRVLVERGAHSFSRPDQAEGSPLGSRLFTIPGVRSVYMFGNFISVGRDPARDWQEIIPKVEQALREHFDE
jgi:hypothetical protein